MNSSSDNSILAEDYQRSNEWFSLKIEAVKAGDRSAFRDLYAGTSGTLLRLAKNIVRDTSLAEDVLQDAFVEIWSNVDAYDGSKGSPFAWMAGVVRYRALDRIAENQVRTDASRRLSASLASTYRPIPQDWTTISGNSSIVCSRFPKNNRKSFF